MTLDPASRFRISRQVLSQEVTGETVLLDLGSEQYFGLDPVGTRVWQMIGEGMALGGIRQALLTEYEVEPQRMASDVDRLLERLLQTGLVEREDVA